MEPKDHYDISKFILQQKGACIISHCKLAFA